MRTQSGGHSVLSFVALMAAGFIFASAAQDTVYIVGQSEGDVELAAAAFRVRVGP